MLLNSLISLIVFLVAFGMTLTIVLSQRLHQEFTVDETTGVQKIHYGEIPRVGGLGIYLALAIGSLFGDVPYLGEILLGGLPLVTVGLYEDITKNGGIKIRLLMAFLSGTITFWLVGYGIRETHIDLLDFLLQNPIFSLVFTSFAVAGLANAFNIIDGVNGLASGTAVFCLAGLGLLSYQVSDYDLTALSGLGLIAILGFMVFNFPWGRIFLGDGGAYFIGFYVAWIAIMLPARNDVVSPLASLLICSYPIIETLFSIFRKTVRTGYHPGLPDRVHFHMLVYRRVASRLLPHGYPIKLKNSLTAVLIFPFGLLPVILVYFNYSDSNYLIFSFFIVFSIYIALYYGIIRFKFGWLHRHGRR